MINKLLCFSLLLLVISGCRSDIEIAKKYYQTGNEQYNRGNLVNAIIWYNKAIALNDTMQEAWFRRAETKLALLDYSGSMSDFSKVIELNPRRTEAYLNRGLIRIYRKEFTAEALADFDKAIALDPKAPEAYYNRGVIYYVQKNLEAACTDWKIAAGMGSIKAMQNIARTCKNIQSAPK